MYVDINGDQQYTTGDPATMTSVTSQWTLTLESNQKAYDLFIQPSNQVEVSPECRLSDHERIFDLSSGSINLSVL